MGKLTKTDLVENINSQTGVSKSDIDKVLESIAVEITAALQRSDSVALPQLGTFKPSHREARMGRNPRTGEQIEIKASNGVKFTAAKGLKEALN